MNLTLISATHFYTQEDFVQSRFRENEQLLTIYYLMEVENTEDLLILDPCIERVEWIPISQENPFELPVDQIIYKKLQEQFL